MNIKRMRGRNNRGGSGGGGNFRSYQGGTPLNRNHVFDSNGPEQRVRGTAQQLFDKYQQLGRDASSGGDRVLAESYFQHAEHYFRIITALNQAVQGHSPGNTPGNGHARRDQNADQQSDDDSGEAPGLGDQPTSEPREIPISETAPEA